MQSITKHNIMDLYMFAKQLNDENLMRVLFIWLSIKPKRLTQPILQFLFENQSFDDLTSLLQKNYITINEERIFTHCIDWVKKQYRTHPKLSNQSPQDIMAPILQYIRFPVMSMQYLSTEVYNSGLLTDEQFLNIIRHKYMEQDDLSSFSHKKRMIEYDKLTLFHFDDEGFAIDDHDARIENIIAFHWNDYDDITDKIDAASSSGDYPNYPVSNIYTDNADYWCSVTLAAGANVWIMFDCHKYDVARIDTRFQSYYSCQIVKVYSSNSGIGNDWNPMVKKTNMTQENKLKIIMRRNSAKYIKLKFEQWNNGYVGIERVYFYQ